MNIIELRNYLLKPGLRDKFVDYFKDHFIQSQNALGAYTPGQYRVKDEDDRFFWIRGFDNMEKRSRFLPAFYGGTTWKIFGPAANEMMLEWHHVHLLKPAGAGISEFDQKQGLVVIDFYTAANSEFDQLTNLFAKTYIPLFHSWGISNISLWISERAENDFPQLPVYQENDLLVVITGYTNEGEYELTLRQINSTDQKVANKIKELAKSSKRLLLYPA